MVSFEQFGSLDNFIPQMDRQGLMDGLHDLHDSFKSTLDIAAKQFGDIGQAIEGVVRDTLGIDDSLWEASFHHDLYDNWPRPLDRSSILPSLIYPISPVRPFSPVEYVERAKDLYDGVDDGNGGMTLSLKKLYRQRLNDNPKERNRNIRQQSGYAAELISTFKENLQAEVDGSGLKTYRADDRPDLGFRKNDQYVDKVRVNEAGEIVERIQTKFIGKDGNDWVSKMMQKKYDKYFVADADGILPVDKIECPKNYYDDAKQGITQRMEKLTKQIEHVEANGKLDEAERKRWQLEKLKRMDDMLEQSMVSREDAILARTYPRQYLLQNFVPEMIHDVITPSTIDAVEGGIFTAGLTMVTTSVDHVSRFLDGEISAQEMVEGIAAESVAAGAIDAAGEFVTSAVARSMGASSNALINTIGNSCLPAAIVSFGVESCDSIMEFAEGKIGGDELARELGDNAATIAGGTLAGMKAGAVVGTAFGPAGTVAGGLVGGLVGSVVASGVYNTALDHAPELASEALDQIDGFAHQTIDAVAEGFPDQVDLAKDSFNDFFANNNIPLRMA